jgi:hypothetical protein
MGGSSGERPAGTASGTGPSTGAAPVVVAHGAPITVGVATTDYTGLATSFGVKVPDVYFAGYQKVFAYLNAHGGLNGHKINAVYRKLNGNASNYDTEAQAACSYLVEDHKVQIVLTLDLQILSFTKCLQDHHVAQMIASPQSLPEQALTALRGYLSPQGLSGEREARAVFSALSESSSKKDKLGVLTESCPQDANLNASLPALGKEYGISYTGVQLSCYNGVGGLGQATSEIQAAVLRFRNAGVQRVFAIVFSEGTTLTLFDNSANNQGYHPHYVVTSNANPYTNTASGSFDSTFLTDVFGVGWAPNIDLGPRAPITRAMAVQRKKCDVMDPSHSNAASAGDLEEGIKQAYYMACDDIFLLGQLLQADGGKISLEPMIAAFEEFASRLVAGGAYDARISVSHSRHDGAARMLIFTYDPASHALVRSGPTYSIP